MTKEEKLYSDEKIDSTVFKCPNCKGEMVFDPKVQKMRCLYCGTLLDVEKDANVGERDLSELIDEGKVWKEAEVYQCQSCGAKEILEHQEVSVRCPFCGTSNVVKTDELPGIKPQGIVPFVINKNEATKIAVSWAKKKRYAPNTFKKNVKAENIHGIYNPVFTFDAKTHSIYKGQLGKNYTVTRHSNGRTYTEVKTRYFYISGSQNVNFDDLLVQASSNIPLSVIRKIEPFDTNKSVKYKTQFLRGYAASTYNKSGTECWDECKTIMKNRIEFSILKKYDYDVKVFLNVQTTLLSKSYKYILVPLYVGHYSFKKTNYNFYVNGENGNVYGKTPVSGWKVFFTVLGVLLLVAGIIALFYFL